VTSTLDDEQLVQAFENIEDKSFSFREFREMQEEMMGVIDAVCSDDDKQLLYARFWLNMSYEEIANEHKVVFQTIYFRVKKLLEKMRKEYDRRCRELQVHKS